jgi:hypothetical protein
VKCVIEGYGRGMSVMMSSVIFMHLDRTLDIVLAGAAHLYGMRAAASCV